MRGIYQATYLHLAANRARASNDSTRTPDVGALFDLIVGTSTGGLIGCALAAGVSLEKITALYFEEGQHIFPGQEKRWSPSFRGWRGKLYRLRGKGANEGAKHLQSKLQGVFGDETLGTLFARRGIALAIPTIDIGSYQAVVLKTKHLERLDGRNDQISLIDLCLATSAAPIVRTMARFEVAGTTTAYLDGGLWANDPSLVAMSEAIEILTDRGEQNRSIHLFTLGTGSPGQGEIASEIDLHRTAIGWKGGLDLLTVSMCAQSTAYSYLASKLAEYRDNDSIACRLPQTSVSATVQMRSAEMDDARKETLQMLMARARADVDHAYRERKKNHEYEVFFDALAQANSLPLENPTQSTPT